MTEATKEFSKCIVADAAVICGGNIGRTRKFNVHALSEFSTILSRGVDDVRGTLSEYGGMDETKLRLVHVRQTFQDSYILSFESAYPDGVSRAGVTLDMRDGVMVTLRME